MVEAGKIGEMGYPSDGYADVPRSSAVGGNRIVFRISGNDYRLVVKFNYAYGVGYVRFIGTHQEYDKVDAERV